MRKEDSKFWATPEGGGGEIFGLCPKGEATVVYLINSVSNVLKNFFLVFEVF